MSIMPPGSESNNAAPDDDEFWAITVEIPQAATAEDVDLIFEAVADAAYDAQPADRNWDIFVHGRGPRPEGRDGVR